jgi:hypothetical protein
MDFVCFFQFAKIKPSFNPFFLIWQVLQRYSSLIGC